MTHIARRSTMRISAQDVTAPAELVNTVEFFFKMIQFLVNMIGGVSNCSRVSAE